MDSNFPSFIRQVIDSGVSEQTIAVLLLLPLVISLVAAIRHLVGFRGFKILIPTLMAAVFLVTGIINGILLFLAILVLATGARIILRFFRLQYLPRMALLLWLVTLGVLGLLYLSTYLGISLLAPASILPILILVLLAEEFIAVQLGKNLQEAARMTMETTLVALIGYLVLKSELLQKLALANPYLILVAPLVINILVGRYTGLRLLEYKRFQKLLK